MYGSDEEDNRFTIENIVKTLKSYMSLSKLTQLFKNSSISGTVTSDVKLADVRGIDEIREEIEEIVEFIKDPVRFQSRGAEIPKGVLMTGPPGTGKTMLAKALSNEAGCNFYYYCASEFEMKFVGEGAAKIREAFKKAKDNQPSIIFIDEVDTITRKRGSVMGAGADQTVNQLLTEMDGFNKTENVIVIGASNMEDKIDSAFKRPGRFDKIINVNLPDVKGR